MWPFSAHIGVNGRVKKEKTQVVWWSPGHQPQLLSSSGHSHKKAASDCLLPSTGMMTVSGSPALRFCGRADDGAGVGVALD